MFILMYTSINIHVIVQKESAIFYIQMTQFMTDGEKDSSHLFAIGESEIFRFIAQQTMKFLVNYKKNFK